jgi:hypothetical protein
LRLEWSAHRQICRMGQVQGNFFSLWGVIAALNFRLARENFIKNSSEFHRGLLPIPAFLRLLTTETTRNSD